MADTNTYTALSSTRKVVSKAEFDAMDKTNIPVGTEYDIVAPIEKTDLSLQLQLEIDGKTYYRHSISFIAGGQHSIDLFLDNNTPITNWATLYPKLTNASIFSFKGSFVGVAVLKDITANGATSCAVGSYHGTTQNAENTISSTIEITDNVTEI